jgi:hypothetical protein
MEQWKPVKGYEGLYEVSNHGRVRSLDRREEMKNGRKRFYKGKLLKPMKDRRGYLYVDLKKDGQRKLHRIHRLVAEAFLLNPDNLPVVNHRDGNKENNHYSNLEWCTSSQNNKHAYDMGLRVKGDKHPWAKLTQAEIDYIRKVYKPYDKECGRRALARKFGVCEQTIYFIVNRKARSITD